MKDQECGYSVASGYIVGGELALRGEFPFAVLLGYDTDETNLKEDVAEDVPSPQTVSQNIENCFLKSTFDTYRWKRSLGQKNEPNQNCPNY